MTTDKQERKERPVARGVLDYFPDALAEVANVSYVGNQQHNPGEEMHWARGKSADHADCVARHLIERGTTDTDGLRHSAKLAWRALALLQIEIEKARTDPYQSFAKLCQALPEKEQTGAVMDAGQINKFARSRTQGSIPKSIAEQVIEPQDYSEWIPFAYISGPMRGYPDFNFPAFDKAKEILTAKGFLVISPADMDREDKNQKPGVLQPAWVYADRDYVSLRLLATNANPKSCVVTLHGYERSTGASAEVAIAKWLGLNIRSIAEFT